MGNNIIRIVNRLILNEKLHTYGAKFVQNLQMSQVPPTALLFASHLGDPPAVNLIAFPLAFFFHPVLGVATLLSINLSEWVNCVLKWVLSGERPYWWVKEHPEAGVHLQQFPITCETGPGSPSGHCMVSVAGWLPLILFLARNHCPRYKLPLYVLAILGAFLIAISRLYVGAHFPHQVIGGILAGWFIGRLMYRWSMTYISNVGARCLFGRHSFYSQRPSPLLCPWRLIVLAVVLFAAAKAIGTLLTQVAGVDVQWSMQLAARHCDHSDWVHPSTSIVASYARVFGSILGLAVALALRPLMPHCSPLASQTLKRVVLSASASLLLVSVFKVMAATTNTLLNRVLSLPLLALGDSAFLATMVFHAALCPVIVALVFPTCFARACISSADLCESFGPDSTATTPSFSSNNRHTLDARVSPSSQEGMHLRNGIIASPRPRTTPRQRRKRSGSASRR